ncbi:MAG: hypothetical protein R3E89_04270 [Thiolinea sp.]
MRDLKVWFPIKRVCSATVDHVKVVDEATVWTFLPVDHGPWSVSLVVARPHWGAPFCSWNR